MEKTISIHLNNVPLSVHAQLAKAASDSGRSLRDYMLIAGEAAADPGSKPGPKYVQRPTP